MPRLVVDCACPQRKWLTAISRDEFNPEYTRIFNRNPYKMSTMVDEPNPSVDPEAEVRKLQDLVKKLEQQNQILRSKQNQNLTLTDPGKDLDKKSISKQNLSNSLDLDADTLKDDLGNISLEEDELIDIDKSINDEDEENW